MFKGKAIYNPSGKAGEYSYWACNFHVGCSNGCEYCYCKKGILAPVMGQDKPQLKKCFNNSTGDALQAFYRELQTNKSDLQKHGLFFSFTTDPMLPETIRLTKMACDYAINNQVPIKILTKRADWIEKHLAYFILDKQYYAFGFTLTGHDELEPGASTNAERIQAMKDLHEAGFKTWASIEPIINFADSLSVISKTYTFCDMYKIGLESGKNPDLDLVKGFIQLVNDEVKKPIYFKDSLLKAAGINRSELPANCVDRDYNLFE